MALPKSLNYFYEYYIDPAFGKRKYILPSHVNFPITDNCNSKCQMCNVWKDKSENELTPEEIRHIFSDKLFKKVNHLGISGGEPTLRKDLIECVVSILEALPKLRSLSITSHGFHPTKWERLLPQIMQLCHDRQVFFKLNISVDGIGELHEEVRRIEGGWEKVVKTIALSKRNNCPLQIQCTVSKHNVFGINEVLHFAEVNDIELIFRKATSINRLYTKDIKDKFFTTDQGDSFLSDFLKSDRLIHHTDNPTRRLFYKDLATRLITGSERNAPCHFQNNGVLISAHGEMFHCSIDEMPLGDCRTQKPVDIYFSDNSKKQLDNLLTDVCPNCIHDQTGTWTPNSLIKDTLLLKFGFLEKIDKYIKFSLKNMGYILGFYRRRIKVSSNATTNSKTLHIIGAYGGEHVGDSGILGGVILRQTKKSSSINKVIVYSKRVDRTLFWVKGLDFDSDLEIIVKDYKELNDIEVSENDTLTWAGGPIMEMPEDLFEHFVTIKAFIKQNIKFEIIGCGWGPFKTIYSKHLAKKILDMATYVQMRDEYDLEVDYDLARDPAFDYLSQQVETSKDWSWSQHKCEEFIKKIKDKGFTKLLLINLRPLWSKYNKSELSIDELHTKVKNSIVEVIKNTPKDVAVVSVPFNTDHYGFSDMDLAMEIKDICDAQEINHYYIFNRELNARDMIAFLKNFDFGLCMRFHACIFMRSLGIPVYGIDYTAGETGKVGGLFKSFNDANYSNILDIDVKKIIEFTEKN